TVCTLSDDTIIKLYTLSLHDALPISKEACPQESSRPQHCRALRSVQPYAEDLVLARRQVRRCCNGSSLQQNFGSQESRRGSPWAAAAGQRGPSKNGPSCCALRDHLALAPPWC